MPRSKAPGALHVALLLVVGGAAVAACNWPWPHEAAEDPFRCDPECAVAEACYHGNCVARADLCGDGVITHWEDCDGDFLDDNDCVALGYKSGTLKCKKDCTFETSGCSNCDNGKLDKGEDCEGSDLGGESCKSLGFSVGTLKCKKDCTFDKTGCVGCGNKKVDAGEKCDGNDLNGATCQTRGFYIGALKCKKDCTFDDAGCHNCGNGKLDSGEKCDLTDLGGATCKTQGFHAGTIKCTKACALDTAGCHNCGNGKLDTGEQCDGAATGGKSCSSLGYSGGKIGCSAACKLDTATCTWAMSMAGSDRVHGASAALDAKGNVYVTGSFGAGSAGSVWIGGKQYSGKGDKDIFVVKLDPRGKVLWGVTAGGAKGDQGIGIAADSAGNTCVVGYVKSASATFGSHTVSSQGDNDLFVTRLDPQGKFLDVVTAGGKGSDWSNSAALDAKGNCHITGAFKGPAKFGSTTLTSKSTQNSLFIAQVDPKGKFSWVTKADVPVGSTIYGEGIAQDALGNSYVTGVTSGYPTLGSFSLSSSGGGLFVAKLDPGGKVVWATAVSGGGNGRGIAVNASGESFVVGNHSGQTKFGGAGTLAAEGSSDFFLAKLDAKGAFSWAVDGGGNLSDQATGVWLTPTGDVLATGFTSGKAMFGTTWFNGGGFVARYDAKGKILWISGGQHLTPSAVAADAGGAGYVTGDFAGKVTFGTKLLTAGTNRAAFVWKVSPGGK